MRGGIEWGMVENMNGYGNVMSVDGEEGSVRLSVEGVEMVESYGRWGGGWQRR